MRKKTIAIFFILGIAVSIIGSILYATEITSLMNTTGATSSDIISAALPSLAAISIGSILLIISWVGSLVAVGKQGRWGWFVCIFFLSGIAELIYLIAGPGL